MTLSTLEILNIVSWYKEKRQDEKKPLGALPLKIQWELKKNIDKISPIADSYMNFKQEIENKLQEEYATDEKSMIDESDNTVRKIKDEYIAEYQKEIAEMTEKLNEILIEQNEIEMNSFDVEDILNNLEDDCGLTIDDLDILNFLNGKNE